MDRRFPLALRARRSTLAGFPLLLALSASACSLAFPADQTQCSSDSDCKARGPSFAGSVCDPSTNVCMMPSSRPDAHADARHDSTTGSPHDASHDVARDTGSDASTFDAGPNDWSCLGHVHFPSPSDAQVTLTVPYTDYLSGKPLVGLRVQPCIRVDPTCINPLTDAAFTNEAGFVSFSLPSGFNGYVLSDWDASIPDLDYIDPPVFAPTVERAQGLLTSGVIGGLASALGEVDGSTISLNPQDGLVFLGTRDCSGALAAGVSFSIAPASSSALIVYIIDMLPTLTAHATDLSGAAAIINVPVGSITVSATLAATGQPIGSVDGYSEAGKISGFALAPEPSP